MIEAIILGIVQGLTEFLPISSSAHVRIFGEFLDGAKDPGARFTAITQIGTELAVLLYFRKSLFKDMLCCILGIIYLFQVLHANTKYEQAVAL